jgi:outer membrane receptor for ferrienterochelin and colicins
LNLFLFTCCNTDIIIYANTFINGPDHLTTQGAETNIKLVMDELVFYLGYSCTDTKQHFNGSASTQPLTPKNQ